MHAALFPRVQAMFAEAGLEVGVPPALAAAAAGMVQLARTRAPPLDASTYAGVPVVAAEEGAEAEAEEEEEVGNGMGSASASASGSIAGNSSAQEEGGESDGARGRGGRAAPPPGGPGRAFMI
jgi:hypothetical protein